MSLSDGIKRDCFHLYATLRKPVLFSVVLLYATVLSPILAAQQTAAGITLRVGMLTGATSRSAQSAERGVRLGVAEAKQTAQLFGGDVQLFETPVGKNPAAAAMRLVSTNRVQVLVVSEPLATDAISKFAEQRRLIFLNLAARDQSLRAACRRYTFHVEASDAMYRNAALLWAQSSRTATASGVHDSVALWWQTLERYGAGQINARYRAKYKTAMDGSAWTGWAAIKIIAESALRTRSAEPSKLIAYLESATTTFDGHKGWPLTFRIADHQLRQPLYILTRDQRSGKFAVHDVPELRATGKAGTPLSGASANQPLDDLIAVPTESTCQWSSLR